MDRYFNEEEMKLILLDDRVCRLDINTVNNRCGDLFKYLNSIGISKNNIKKMILKFPRLLTYSIDFVVEGYNNAKNIFGNSTNKNIIECPRIFSRDSKHLNDLIKYFTDYGFDKEDITKIFNRFPIIITLGIDKINVNVKFLEYIIKDRNKIIYLIKKCPNVLSFSIDKLVSKIRWFYDKGYNKEQIGNIVSRATSLLTMDFEKNDGNINNKYNYLKNELCLSNDEIIDVTNRYPIIYTLSLNNIKNKINCLLELGFNLDMVRVMFYKFPQIVGVSEKSIYEKYNYYNKIGLLCVFVFSPKSLMQGLELTDARYTYLLDKGIEVSEKSYKKLFLGDKDFKKSYGITNDELLERYRSLMKENSDVKVLKRIK